MINYKEHRWITLIIASYIVLGILYSSIIPVGEAPDEPGHFAYIKYLAETHRFPAQNFEYNRNVVAEGHQPPLYYLVGALATFWIDMSEFGRLKPNPHFSFFPGDLYGKSMFLHTNIEACPYRGIFLAFHIVRWLSVLVGAVTVWVTYCVGRKLFPEEESIALGAAALNAFLPQFIFINSVINNDSLAIMLSALTLLSLIKILQGSSQTRDFVVLGVLIGLGALTKYSALPLVPLAVLVISIVSMEEGSIRGFIRRLGFTFLPALLVSGWWYLRNQVLYGDPLGWAMWLSSYAAVVRISPLTWFDIQQFFKVQYTSFWAQFGWMNIKIHSYIYAGLVVVCLSGLVGILIFAIRQKGRLKSEARWGLALLVLSVVCIYISALRLVATFDASIYQGRYLFPAISAIAVLLALGLAQFAPRRLAWLPVSGLGLGMFALAVACLLFYITPAYAQPRLLQAADLSSIQHSVHLNFDGKIELVGYELESNTVKPGEKLKLAVCWRALATMEQSYIVFVHVIGRDGRVIGQLDAPPYRGRYVTLQWNIGDVFCDKYEVTISPQAIPSLGKILIGYYPWKEVSMRLPIYDREGHLVGDSFTLARFKIAPVKSPSYTPQHPLQVNFADKITLIGYDLPQETIKAADTLRLALCWQARAKMDEGYTVFVHLLDEENQIVAQHDSQPQNGNYPTSIWDIDEVVKDEHEIVLNPDTSSGRYRLEAGLYLLTTGERLPAFVGGKRLPEDRVLLREVQVGNER